jgi:prevent-host-death family protein
VTARITVSELRTQLAQWVRIALTRGPVLVSSHRAPLVVLVSYTEYLRLTQEDAMAPRGEGGA